MDIRTKVLVIGLAVSGLQTVKALHGLGARVRVNDRKSEAELKEAISAIKGLNVDYVLGGHPPELADWPDFAVISPGIPMDIPMVQRIKESGREVISEVELAYRLTGTPIVAITGTNGKTTTTALTGEIFRRLGRNTHVAGNIGTPLIDAAVFSQPSDILVAEISSFQLEGIRDFKPRAAAVLNITPDHLDRHKTFDNYKALKARVFENNRGRTTLRYNAANRLPLRWRMGAGQGPHFSLRIMVQRLCGKGYIIIKGQKLGKFARLPTQDPERPQPGKRPCRCSRNVIDGGAGKSHRGCVEKFEGVEHRRVRGHGKRVVYINDSRAPIPMFRRR